ncbi:MAG: copper chaperone PCu(A)C [Candidatus Sedimenticola sp. (ex Thyasira tokunagai)]
MKIHSIVLASAFGLLAFCGSVMAGGIADSVEAGDPYARAVPPGQPNSASFMALTNKSSMDHALVAAESSVSKVVELHTHINDNGMMRMRRVEKIDLPAGKMVMLKPGGHHVMLIGLKKQLMPGESIDITLIFDDGSKKAMSVPVRKLQMKMMKGGMKHDMKMMNH